MCAGLLWYNILLAKGLPSASLILIRRVTTTASLLLHVRGRTMWKGSWKTLPLSSPFHPFPLLLISSSLTLTSLLLYYGTPFVTIIQNQVSRTRVNRIGCGPGDWVWFGPRALIYSGVVRSTCFDIGPRALIYSSVVRSTCFDIFPPALKIPRSACFENSSIDLSYSLFRSTLAGSSYFENSSINLLSLVRSSTFDPLALKIPPSIYHTLSFDLLWRGAAFRRSSTVSIHLLRKFLHRSIIYSLSIYFGGEQLLWKFLDQSTFACSLIHFWSTCFENSSIDLSYSLFRSTLAGSSFPSLIHRFDPLASKIPPSIYHLLSFRSTLAGATFRMDELEEKLKELEGEYEEGNCLCHQVIIVFLWWLIQDFWLTKASWKNHFPLRRVFCN